jgi:hypothetical protein
MDAPTNTAEALYEDDAERIFPLAEECEALFSRETSRLEAANASNLRHFEEQQQRFTAWTGYLGVFAERTVCLDYRLRYHSDLQDLVLRLLDILRANLLQREYRPCNPSPAPSRPVFNHLALVTDPPSGLEFTSSQPADKPQSGGDANPRRADALAGIEGAIDRLNRLGIAIRRSSNRHLTAKNSSDDRYIQQLTRDIVKTLYPSANEDLHDMLGRSMADRYHKIASLQSRNAQLQQRRPHQAFAGLGPVAEGVEEAEAEDKNEQAPGEGWNPPQNQQQPTARLLRLPPVSPWGPMVPRSEASTVNREFVRQIMGNASNAGSRKLGASSSIQINQGVYPRPPVGPDRPNFVTCPWCGETRTRQAYEGDTWR